MPRKKISNNTLTKQDNEELQEAVPPIRSVSDASTIGGNIAESDLNCDDDVHLEQLKTEAFLQCSQASVIEALITQVQVENKPNLNVLPTFAEHDCAGYGFQIKAMPEGKIKWEYSERFNKIYVPMNEICKVEVSYKRKLPIQKLHIRAFLSYIKEVNEPVLRCQNHMSKDNVSNDKERESFLRCEYPGAEYVGSAEGKIISERFCVIIPLNEAAVPKDDQYTAEVIPIKFMCQNSCIGRKGMNIVFLLEGMNGKILGQRVMEVKVCCCPKRDKAADDEKNKANKEVTPKNKLKTTRSSGLLDNDNRSEGGRRVKVERESGRGDDGSGDNDENMLNQYDVQRTPGGGYRLVVELCSQDVVLHSLDAMINKIASKIVLEGNAKRKLYNSNLKAIKRLCDRAKKL